MKTITRLLVIALTFACSADAPMAVAQAAENQGANAAMTWEKADVFVPGRFLTTTPNKVKVDKPLPVVIYLHGCTGIADHDKRWGGFIKGLGYIAVLPDSMARPGRIPNCDPKKKRAWCLPPRPTQCARRRSAMRLNRSGRSRPGPTRTMSF